MSETNGSNKTMRDLTMGALVGGLVGAGIALLYAPASGTETRKKVKEATDKIKDRFKSGVEKIENMEE